jgi:hypothetical protein
MDLDKDRKYNKARELRNSTPLRKYKSLNSPEVISVVDHLYDEMVGVYGLSLIRSSSIKNLRHHIEFFVLNLYKVYCNDPTKVIAYSRDRNAYSGKKYKHKFGLSFRYSVDEGKNGKPVISFLERQDYIENFGFQHDRNNPNNSYQSRMRATSKLINLIVDQYEVSEDMIEHDVSADETVVVKGVKPKPKYVSVIEDGKKKRKKLKRKRRVCKTPNNPIVREMRKNLEIINEVMEKADITLDISEEGLKRLNARMLNDPDPYKQVVDFSRKRLHRVFLDRRFDRGGRFFGPWYQNIPKEYRQHIMIDGAPTMELDYSALHPNLLYYYAGVDPPKGDLYELKDYSEDTRNFMKAMFLRMINSPSPYEAKGSIRKAAFYVSKKTKKRKRRIKIPTELGNLDDIYLDPLIDKFLEKHKPLADRYIFKVKDLGNILQNVDSRIAEKVLLYFAYENISVLPLHDSFRIDARLYEKLQEIMLKVIIESFGKPIRISNDDYVPLMGRLVGMVEDQIKSGDYDEERLNSLIQDLEPMFLGSRLSAKIKKLKDKSTLK